MPALLLHAKMMETALHGETQITTAPVQLVLLVQPAQKLITVSLTLVLTLERVLMDQAMPRASVQLAQFPLTVSDLVMETLVHVY